MLKSYSNSSLSRLRWMGGGNGKLSKMPRRELCQIRNRQGQAAVQLQKLWLSAHRGRECGVGAEVRRQALQLYLEGMGFPRHRPFFGGQPRCRVLLDQGLRQGRRIDPQHGHRSQGGGDGRVAQLCRA